MTRGALHAATGGYPPGTMKRTNGMSRTILMAGLVALGGLPGALLAGPGAEGARILEDTAAHFHAIHSQNPLIARFKGFYPSRVHLTIEGSEPMTLLNDGPQFQVASGLYGKAYLVIETTREAVEEVYEMVKGGGPAEGMPRVEMAAKVRDITALSLEPPAEPDRPGPGPQPRKLEKGMIGIVDSTKDLLTFMGKAGEAKAKGKKLPMVYFGLRAKLAMMGQGKKQEKLTEALIAELGADLDEGRLPLQSGKVWSTFVDVFSFFMMTREPGASGFSGVLTPLKERIQGLLNYHKTLPPGPPLATRNEILENRLALVQKMLDVNDA